MIKKFKFSLATTYIQSEVSEIVEIELDGDETEKEIEDIAQELYEEWVWEHNYGGYEEVE